MKTSNKKIDVSHWLTYRDADVGYEFDAEIHEVVDLGDGDGFASRAGYGRWRVLEVGAHERGGYWCHCELIRRHARNPADTW